MGEELTQAQGNQAETTLNQLYKDLPVAEQEYFKQKDYQIWQTSQMAVINLGRIALDVKSHISNPGTHSGISFKRWYEGHGFGKSQIHRAMRQAEGYNQLLASDDPDREQMINNYLALPKMYQEMIATGKADSETADLILRSDAEFRKTPHFKALLKSLDEQKTLNAKVQATNQSLQAENHRLTKHNADVEKSRSETLVELEKERQRSRHLQLENERLQHREVEEKVVPPDDYDDIKQHLLELKQELQDSNDDLAIAQEKLQAAEDNRFSKEDIDDLQATIDQLTNENKTLHKKVQAANDAAAQKRLAFERVSAKTAEMLTAASRIDVLALTPDIEKLSTKEISQTDLANLGQWFLDRATQIQDLCKGKQVHLEDQKIIDGEFSDAK
ncbi:hypothetical protein [uncultured Limosilactobacillus sp.]|uniref:hypothetical protein n=1 Tax=uncultured Limosilactobacillus sp. TaxID=2837629 RepID=UPI0025EDBC72|nr:hypothetical protein [uncultured Limosilactobacillus sp.]